jgi:hypothetical protein
VKKELRAKQKLVLKKLQKLVQKTLLKASFPL